MRTKHTIALLILVGVVGSTQAAWQGRAHWIGGGAAGVYYDAANWIMEAGDAAGANAIPANLPGLEYDMFLDNLGDVALSTDTLVNVAHLGGAGWAGHAASDVTLTINGGTVETIWWMVLGEDFGSSGTINMNGGTLTVGTHPTDINDLMLGAHNGGSGTLNMNAGTVNADVLHVGFNVGGANVSQQTAELNLAGGTVHAGALFMNAQGYIDITGGTLVIDGDVRGNINSWVGLGQIVADGGAGAVFASYDGSQTQVSATNTNPNISLFSNPLSTPPTGADPFVLKYEGVYYLYCTAENGLTDTGIPVYTSTNLVDWSGPVGNGPSGLALHEKDVWGDTWFWGGDVIEKDGTFYMYATVEEHLIVATSASPLGPFTQTIQQPMHSTKEIDASVFTDDDGKHYIYYVRFEGGNVEYVAELSDDLLSMKEETITFCLRAQSGTWERGPNEPQASVLEGAYAVKHNGLYYLIYTANHFISIDYSMGYATSASPFGPWTRYSGNPILQATAFVHGPGNGMVIESPDGSEMFLFYHVHYDLNNVGPRRVALDRIWFETDPLGGPDILVLNGPTVALQPYPSAAPPIGNIALEWVAGTGDLALTWNTGAGYVYALQSKSNLVDGTWADDTTGIVGPGGDVTVTTTVDQVQSSFYRIILE